MIEIVGASSSDIYEAVLSLSRSIAGHSDHESLLSGVAKSLRQVVDFEYVALILYDPAESRMQSYVLSASGPVDVPEGARFPLEQDPSGWVWLNQQPLVIPSVEGETRWLEFMERVRCAGLHETV